MCWRSRWSPATVPLLALLSLAVSVPLAALGRAEDPLAEALQSAAEQAELQRFRVVVGAVLVEPGDLVGDRALLTIPTLIYSLVQDVSEREYAAGELEARIRHLALGSYSAELTSHADEVTTEARGSLEAPSNDRLVTDPTDPPAVHVSKQTVVDLASFDLDKDRVAVEIELAEPQIDTFTAAALRAAAAADGTDADLYLYSVVRPAADVVLLELRTSHPTLERDERIFAAVTDPDELSATVAKARPAIVAAIAGGPRATLEVRVNPAESNSVPLDEVRLYLDDRLLGVGGGIRDYLKPGSHRLVMLLEDGRRSEQQVVLEPNERHVVEFDAPARLPNRVLIQSEPPGAIVYRGALPVGTTPLRIGPAVDERVYVLRLEDYYDSRVIVDPDDHGRIKRTMVPLSVDWEAQVEESRDRFYRAFGLFALSLAGPIYLQAEYSNIAALDPAAAQPLQYGYYASLGLSGTAFVNMIRRIRQYLDVAQGYHVR